MKHVVSSNNDFIFSFCDNFVLLWTNFLKNDNTPLKCIQHLSCHSDPIIDIFAIDDQRLATISNTSIQIWDVKTLKKTQINENDESSEGFITKKFRKKEKIEENLLACQKN